MSSQLGQRAGRLMPVRPLVVVAVDLEIPAKKALCLTA